MLAQRLAQIPGVVGVSLGGSRATGMYREDSDWDFGLYYRDTIDPDDVRALGWPGQVFAPGEWGRLVNGGAWLQVDSVSVDLIYRDLDEVLAWTAEQPRVVSRSNARLATSRASPPTSSLENWRSTKPWSESCQDVVPGPTSTDRPGLVVPPRRRLTGYRGGPRRSR